MYYKLRASLSGSGEGSGLELNLTRSPLMKIEIQSIKITFKKWWHLALNIAVAVLCFKAPELVVRLFQTYFSSD